MKKIKCFLKHCRWTLIKKNKLLSALEKLYLSSDEVCFFTDIICPGTHVLEGMFSFKKYCLLLTWTSRRIKEYFNQTITGCLDNQADVVDSKKVGHDDFFSFLY